MSFTSPRRFAARAAVAIAALLGVLATSAPTAEAGPPRTPELVITGPAAIGVLGGITSGPGGTLCPVSLTADGAAAYFSVTVNPGLPWAGVYRRDLRTGAQQRVLVGTTADPVDCGVVSPDGQRYAYTRRTGTGTDRQLRLLDTATGAAATLPLPAGAFANATELQFSADHRLLFFIGGSGVLFVYDLQNVNVGALAIAQINSSQSFAGTRPYSISDNGHQVAYGTWMSNKRVIEVIDLPLGQRTTASLRHGQPIAAGSALISGDGTRVVYEAVAEGATPAGSMELTRLDLATGTRTPLTRGVGGVVANGTTVLQDISDDGQVVAFTSTARNLVSGVTFQGSVGPFPDLSYGTPLFVRGRTGTTSLITTTAANANVAVASGGGHARLDGLGAKLVFGSYSKELIAGYQGNSSVQVYAHDLGSGTTALVTPGGEGPTSGHWEPSERPTISATGGQVLFTRLRNTSPTELEHIARIDTGTTPPVVARRAGVDRFATAALVSQRWFDTNVPVAYVASGQTFPDALAAGPIAGYDQGPVLLTEHGSLPDATRAELLRLRPAQIVVVGGTTAISDAVATALDPYTNGSVSRVGGPDRYATAVALVKSRYQGAGTVFVATGESYPDALSGGAVAASTGPTLLVQRDSIPAAVASELARLDPSTIVVLGGPTAISDTTVQALRATGATVVRRAGADRYATSAAISAASFSPGVRQVILATGETFPDALGAAPVAGESYGPVLLVRKACVPGTVADEIARLRPDVITVLGGDVAISPAVLALTRCAS